MNYVIDPDTFETLDVLSDNPYDFCYGARVGCTSEMCGGCDGCLALQALHYGLKLEPKEYSYISRLIMRIKRVIGAVF